MPIISAHFRERFIWQTDEDGTPIGEAVTLGGHLWLVCCPLCGCWHETSAARMQSPRCLLREFATGKTITGLTGTGNWKQLYAAWIGHYPNAAAHTEIRVQVVTCDQLAARPAVRLVSKPTRKTGTARSQTKRKAKAA